MYQKWTSIWGNAVSIAEHRPEGYGKNITFCYPIYSPFSGDEIKLTFDNFCGTEAVTIAAASVYYKNKFYPIQFTHRESVSIAAGESVVCDALPLSVEANTTFEVRFYFKEYVQLRSAVFVSGPLSEGLYAVGNHTASHEIAIACSRKTNIFYFLSNVSLHTSPEKRAIVCYGDSITAQAWPDYLKKRCLEEGYFNTSIIRRATSGSRILREYDCITYESYGLKGIKRFEHEVPTEGADTIIIQQGINDIIHPVGTDINPFRPMSDLPTATELIDGMKWYIEKARSYQYQVYVGTLLPIEGWRTYAPFRESLRQEYNDWIRSTTEIDGCIDFDLATRNPSNPRAFASGMDSGDHLHPSLKGYEAMAATIPSILLR